MLQCVAVCCGVIASCRKLLDKCKSGTNCSLVQHCNALQRTATHCNALQDTATHCNTLQNSATHCNTLQHTATHCNALQVVRQVEEYTIPQKSACYSIPVYNHCSADFWRFLTSVIRARDLMDRITGIECNLCCSALQCYNVLQCVAVCCSALQYAAMCCSVVQYVVRVHNLVDRITGIECNLCCSVLQCVAVCCSVLQCVAVRCSAL